MTSIGKCHCKKSLGKNTDFKSFWILECQIRGPTLYFTLACCKAIPNLICKNSSAIVGVQKFCQNHKFD
jgi:hypothetical protein